MTKFTLEEKRHKTLKKHKTMINSLNSIAAIKTALMRLTCKQKQFIYQIARLEYRIYKSLLKWDEVNALIEDEEQNLKSLNAAIQAAGKGKVADKLLIWKTKSEYRLFKLNLRKNKIEIIKVVINQSKLEQTKQALVALEKDIAQLEIQKQQLSVVVTENKNDTTKKGIFESWENFRQNNEENPINKSIRAFMKDNLLMAS